MKRDEWILDVWEKEYGDAVPLKAIRAFFQPTSTDYLTQNYKYDPIMKCVVHKRTGVIQSGTHISLGARLSPITRKRGEWILRMGTDPWRIGSDDDGSLWAKESKDGGKVYAT